MAVFPTVGPITSGIALSFGLSYAATLFSVACPGGLSLMVGEENKQNAGSERPAGDAERRQFLRFGAYAAYTAPILLAMATSAQAQVGSPTVVECDLDNPVTCEP